LQFQSSMLWIRPGHAHAHFLWRHLAWRELTLSVCHFSRQSSRVRMSNAMKDWNVDYINQYFSKVHEDKVICQVTEKKGRILVSNRSYKKGEVIFDERPLHIVTEAESNDAFKLVQKLCKKDPESFEQDALWYWAALCSLTSEDMGEGPKKGHLPKVEPDTQRKILCLYHEPITEASGAAKTLVEEFRLSASVIKVDELIRAWILNCFDHSEKPQGYVSYFGASFMSHSCHPNAVWHFAEGTQAEDTFVLHARRDIEPGDEICISYLPEQGLLHSAAARKRDLQSSKSFICTCERCGPDAAEPDRCRGFRCPKCFAGAVFHPGPLKGLTLATATCGKCGELVGPEDGKRLLAAEADLQTRLNRLDTQVEKKTISRILKESDVQHLLRMVGDSAAGSVGPQHWLCDRLWAHLADLYDQTGREEDACRMLRLREKYMREAYTSLHGELAWTLEAEADMLCKHAGLGSAHLRLSGLDDAAVRRLALQAAALLEEATQLLRLLFGGLHSYFAALDRKRKRLRIYLETGTWPKLPAKRKRASS